MSMNVLFEEDGGFKTGVLMADNDSSLQIESVSGKRSKIKSANVLLRFADPSPAALIDQAEPLASNIEPDFLWECVSDGEFSFLDFARDYFGHPPSAVEATSILLRLHAAPVYFHRKGKGRFRRAPADILAAALAGLEKKRQQALAIERMVGELKAGVLPAELKSLTRELLYQADRNKPETKALEAACNETGLSAPALLMRCGALASAHDYHLGRFLHDHFPRGTDFPEVALPPPPGGLPRADVRAFSIDDAATTEIDDAFSLQELPGIGWRVGIHIAAPGLSIQPGSPLDEIARQRLSTVYMPGRKITMLPDAAVETFTLAAGRDCPALSIYLSVTPEFEISAHESRAEIVPVVANLRHHDIEPLFNAATIAAGLPEFAFRDELLLLWKLACACEGRRGKPSAMQGNHDYNVLIDGDLSAPETGRVDISERQRGSPLDKLVAELMIVANSTWGGLLAEHKVAGLFRAQTAGKVRMTTQPAPHEGLGVAQYAWSTSPLRRYTDLVNQWQLLAILRDETPHFGRSGGKSSDALFSAMRDFELAYAAYAEFQRQMERYWCLRWLQQEQCDSIVGRVLRREEMVRLERLPLVLRVPSLPAAAPGTRVRLSVGDIDELALLGQFRYQETLDVATATPEGTAGDAPGAEEDEATSEA